MQIGGDSGHHQTIPGRQMYDLPIMRLLPPNEGKSLQAIALAMQNFL